MKRFIYTIILMLLVFVPTAHATRIRDLCEIQGARGNMLKGIGLVVGLAGTGDSAEASIRAQQRMLERMDIDVDAFGELSSENIAVVMVTAMFPAFAKEGTRIDVNISSLYDCESLEGGMLMETHLRGPGAADAVYAVAQGPVSVGGFNAGAGGTSVTQNHVTAGRIPMGAFIEQEIPSTITDGERVSLLLKRPDFTTADNIQQVINSRIAPNSAAALGAGTVNVTIPEEARNELVSFIARLEALDVEVESPSRVVINERTGTLVVGGEVMIRPCQVAHGNLSIEIASTPVIAVPLPFTELEEPVVTDVVDVAVNEEPGFLMPVAGTSASDVAEALNALKVTPRDMISIFQALREAGALDADLEIM